MVKRIAIEMIEGMSDALSGKSDVSDLGPLAVLTPSGDASKIMGAGGVEVDRLSLTWRTDGVGAQWIDFTGIPSWARCIEVIFDNFSGSASASALVRLRPAGGSFVASGYVCSYISSGSGAAQGNTEAAGFAFTQAHANQVASGQVTLWRVPQSSGLDAWVMQGGAYVSASNAISTAGRLAAVGAIDAIRVGFASGTCDSGVVGINIKG